MSPRTRGDVAPGPAGDPRNGHGDGALGALRVVLVVASSAGGVARHAGALVRDLRTLGCQVAVLCPAAVAEAFGYAAAGATVRVVEIAPAPRPARDLRAVREVRRQVRALRADVVHAHGFRATAVAGLALGRRRRGRTPLVSTWHNAVLATGARRLLPALVERLAARRADVTLGASADLVARAASLGAARAEPFPVPAGPLPGARTPPGEVRRSLGVGARPFVLTVGRLAPQKNHDLLLDAAAIWRDAAGRPSLAGDPPAGPAGAPVLAVVGGGPLHGHLRARIDREHLPVLLLGERADVADLLEAADVFVLGSDWEARALVVQEAMRAGVPVVATAVGGIPELVGDAGRLVPRRDARALADAVTGLLADPRLRSRLGDRGARIAREWSDEQDTARRLLRLYEELAGR